jgi:peptidyl-prolyl cis-trans isomerase D
MLQNMRERFTGPGALVILGLIVVPFVFVGVSSPLIGSGYAAKVDGDEISLPAFENAWQNQVAQNPEFLNYPPQYQNLLREQILNRLIRDRLVVGYLNNSGMRIDDAAVTDLIQQIPAYQVDGVFSMEQYRSALQLEGRSAQELEATVAQSLRQYQLQQAIALTAFVTPAEYRRYLNLFAEQREVTVATIGFADIKESVEISEEEIAEFYEARQEEFFTDETVDLEYIEIRRDTLAENVAIDEDDLQLYYEGASSRYLQDEQRQASHIMVPFGDDEDAAREQVNALTARVQAGEPFDDLAKQYSKDGMTSDNGGDLGLKPRSQLSPALGDAIFSMREGEIRGPVKTDFGFHVVKLDEIVGGGPLPLEQVRAELERELRDRQADADFRELENAVSDAMFEAMDIQTMAEKVGLEVQSASDYTRAGGEPFGTNQAAIDAIFDSRVLIDGEVSDIIEIDANRSVAVRVAQHHQAERKTLEEVSEQISGALKSARAQDLIADQSQELQVMLERGDDIIEAAATIGATVAPATVVGRIDKTMDQRLLAAVFRSKKPVDSQPRVGAAITATGDYAVFILSAVARGRPESIPLADRDSRKQELAEQSGSADFTAFLSELEQRATIVRNDTVLQSEDAF